MPCRLRVVAALAHVAGADALWECSAEAEAAWGALSSKPYSELVNTSLSVTLDTEYAGHWRLLSAPIVVTEVDFGQESWELKGKGCTEVLQCVGAEAQGTGVLHDRLRVLGDGYRYQVVVAVVLGLAVVLALPPPCESNALVRATVGFGSATSGTTSYLAFHESPRCQGNTGGCFRRILGLQWCSRRGAGV